MNKLTQSIPSLMWLSTGALFSWVFYVRYWKWRACIEAARSSCITPDGDNLTQGGMIWVLPALTCISIGALMLWRTLRSSGVK